MWSLRVRGNESAWSGSTLWMTKRNGEYDHPFHMRDLIVKAALSCLSWNLLPWGLSNCMNRLFDLSTIPTTASFAFPLSARPGLQTFAAAFTLIAIFPNTGFPTLTLTMDQSEIKHQMDSDTKLGPHFAKIHSMGKYPRGPQASPNARQNLPHPLVVDFISAAVFDIIVLSPFISFIVSNACLTTLGLMHFECKYAGRAVPARRVLIKQA